MNFLFSPAGCDPQASWMVVIGFIFGAMLVGYGFGGAIERLLKQMK